MKKCGLESKHCIRRNAIFMFLSFSEVSNFLSWRARFFFLCLEEHGVVGGSRTGFCATGVCETSKVCCIASYVECYAGRSVSLVLRHEQSCVFRGGDKRLCHRGSTFTVSAKLGDGFIFSFCGIRKRRSGTLCQCCPWTAERAQTARSPSLSSPVTCDAAFRRTRTCPRRPSRWGVVSVLNGCRPLV